MQCYEPFKSDVVFLLSLEDFICLHPIENSSSIVGFLKCIADSNTKSYCNSYNEDRAFYMR